MKMQDKPDLPFTVPATGYNFSESEYHDIVIQYRAGIPMKLIARKYAVASGQSVPDALSAVEYMIYRYVKLLAFWTGIDNHDFCRA